LDSQGFHNSDPLNCSLLVWSRRVLLGRVRPSRAVRRKTTSTLEQLRAEREKAGRETEVAPRKKLPVDRSKIFSRSVLPIVPTYYQDQWFDCKKCGARELWTAKAQKVWYEEQGGEIEAIAIHCRACRRKEKVRREAARKAHLEGVARKAKKAAVKKFL
jgi:hypothetical protein